MNESPQSPQSDQNLPVPHQQMGVGRPIGGGGRVAPPQSWQTGEPEAVPWGQYLDALRRRWWVILLVTLVGSYAGRWYSHQIPALYESSIKIFVSPLNRGGGGGGGPITAPSVLTITTLRDIVKHPVVVVPVVRQLRLNVHYDRWEAGLFHNFSYDSVYTTGAYRFTVDTAGQGYVLAREPRSESPEQEVGALSDSVFGRQFGFRWQPPSSALKPKRIIDFRVNDVTGEALGLSGAIGTSFDEEGGQILTLTLEGTNPDVIAPTLNAWAAEFVDYVTEAKRLFLTDRRKVLDRQLAQAREQMDAAEYTLRRFRENNIFAPTETAAPTGSIALQASQLELVRRDRDRIREVLDTLATARRVDDGRLFTSASIMTANQRLPDALRQLANADQELARMRQDFAEGSPNVQRALAQLLAVRDTMIPEILRGIDLNLRETEATLDSTVSARRGELSQVPRRVFDNLRLQRSFDASVQLWTGLNQSAEQAKLQDEQTSSDLAIMGPAIPPGYPSSSRGPRIFIMAVGASIAAGLAIALLLDRLDRRFRYPQQATMELGLTIAGTIPYFKPNRKGELNLSASAQVVESFRTLRLATQFHFPVGEPVVVCISSPGPGEGKSLVASNLAVAFANAGQKTLLIDGDVRRGVVHTTFEAERRPGLVDYLGGTATPLQIVRPTSTEHLFIISSGSRSRRAPELLTSDRMAALVAEMRTQYEVVIIDSAPFVAGMDAFALGVAAGTMLVVLRPGLTDRKLAENKLEIFDRLPVTIIGAVLNAISSGRAYRYYSDYATYEGVEDSLDEADFDQGAPPPTSPTRLIGRRKP